MSKNSTSSWGESITCANLAHVCAAADATSSVLELVQKVICKLCILLFHLCLSLWFLNSSKFSRSWASKRGVAGPAPEASTIRGPCALGNKLPSAVRPQRGCPEDLPWTLSPSAPGWQKGKAAGRGRPPPPKYIREISWHGLREDVYLVNGCAGSPLHIRLEITTIPVTVGIGLRARTCIRDGAHPPSCGCCWIAGRNTTCSSVRRVRAR